MISYLCFPTLEGLKLPPMAHLTIYCIFLQGYWTETRFSILCTSGSKQSCFYRTILVTSFFAIPICCLLITLYYRGCILCVVQELLVPFVGSWDSTFHGLVFLTCLFCIYWSSYFSLLRFHRQIQVLPQMIYIVPYSFICITGYLVHSSQMGIGNKFSL